MAEASWQPPIVRVEGAGHRPLPLEHAWEMPTVPGSNLPFELEGPGPSGDDVGDQAELAFAYTALCADGDERIDVLAAGLLACGLRLLAALRSLGPDAQSVLSQAWLLAIEWLDGTDLSDRADEVTLRARFAVDLLDARGSGPEARLSAAALLRLPAGHPLRDEQLARRALLRHLRSSSARSDPVWELLTLEQLIVHQLVTHRTTVRYLDRALALREVIADPDLQRRTLVAGSGYYTSRALEGSLPPAARQRAAAHAVDIAEQLTADGSARDPDDQLVLAVAYDAAGRDDDAVHAYAAGLHGRAVGDSVGLRRAALQLGVLSARLGDYERAASTLADTVPALEQDYLLATTEEQVSETGEAFTAAAVTLAFCHAVTGAWEDAFSYLERSKSLRTRHRAALQSSESGKRFLDVERTLLAWQRGATVRFTSDEPRVTDPASTVKLTPFVAAGLPADDRLHQLRHELADELIGTRPHPPVVSDWAGLLSDTEAVLSIGIAAGGSWWSLVTATSARHARVASHGIRTDWTADRWEAAVSEPEPDSWLVALLSRRDEKLRCALTSSLIAADDFLTPIAAELDELGVTRLRVAPHGWSRLLPLWASPTLASVIMTTVASAAAPTAISVPDGLGQALVVADPTEDLWVAVAESEIVGRYLAPLSVTRVALLRRDAIKADVLAAAQTADIVHIAAHGRTDMLVPARSAIWLHDPAACLVLAEGGDPFADLAASVNGWRQTSPGTREVVIRGAGLLAEYDAGDGNLERKLEHPLGSTRWIRYGSRAPKVAELWTAEEITVGRALPRCRLAVLTACEAGGGGYATVDEATGLPAAFAAVGAGSVVASLWPVDDDLAVLFTERFYRHLSDSLTDGAGAGVDVAALCARARNELRTSSADAVVDQLDQLISVTADIPARARLRVARARHAAGPSRPFEHPIHWAAFAVFGDGWLPVGQEQEVDTKHGR